MKFSNRSNDDELPDSELHYDAELEESILLYNTGLSSGKSVKLNGLVYNAVYLRLLMSNQRLVYLFIIFEKPELVWTNIIEQFRIKTDIIIDNHKGLGDWFENVPLYKMMKETHQRDLLPELYFKGKYISHEAPKGFVKAYEVRENKPHQCMSEIYYTRWK